MKVIGVIPARFGSERFYGKVLADILGKPLIWWVWNSVKRCKILQEIFIATDDVRVYNVVNSFGGKAVFTSKKHKSGTDRIAEVVKKVKADIVVNVQGDEPLIRPAMIRSAVSPFFEDKSVSMATLVCKVKEKRLLYDNNIVKVVIDKNGYALYFSRSIIPSLARTDKFDFFYKHIGVYVYKKDFLLKFVNLKESRLEKIEKLEQLRVLENGYKIKTVVTPYDTIPVDTPEDLRKVVRFLKTNVRRLYV